MLTAVALPYQTYELTNSSLAVGLIGAAQVVPMVGLALFTGALADALDRRRLIIYAELGACLAGALLVVNALLDDPKLWVLYLAAMLSAGGYTLLRPPLDAMFPRLLPRGGGPAAPGPGAVPGPARAGLRAPVRGPPP